MTLKAAPPRIPPSWLLSGAALLVLTTASPCQAQGEATTGAGEAAHLRSERFKELGRTFKAITKALEAAPPDPQLLATSARRLQELAAELPSWFPAGSGPDAGVKTRAKAEIWTEPTLFRSDADDLDRAAGALEAAVAAADPEQIARRAKTVGESCKTCHTRFRAPDAEGAN